MAELNGTPADPAQLRALALTNYGHFTSMRVERGGVRGLNHHLDRLVRDCRAVFDAELDPSRVRHLVRHAVGAVAGPLVVRVTVFDPGLDLGHPGRDARPHVLVTTRGAPRLPLAPARLRSVTFRREFPEVKHVGLFGPMWHRRAAQRGGYDDALFTDGDAMISEAATSNIGFVDGDRVVWPDAPRLPGVTMRLVDEARGEPARTAPVALADLPGVRAVFLTNAAVGIRRVGAVDGVAWPDGDRVVDALRARYAALPVERL